MFLLFSYRYTPAPSNSTSRRHISLQQRFITDSQQQQQQQQQLQQQISNGGSVGPPLSVNNALPPDGRTNYSVRHPTFPYAQGYQMQHISPVPNSVNHQREHNHLPYTNQRSPDNQHGLYHHPSSDKTRTNNLPPPDVSGRYSPFQRRLGESPPDDRVGRFSPSPRRRDTDVHDGNRFIDSQNTTPVMSPYQQRRSNVGDRLMNDGFWQSPICSPLPVRKHYQNTPAAPEQQYNHASNTSPILLQRFYHQQKQYQQQQHQAAAAQSDVEGNKDDNGGKKRFASHIKLQLVGDRVNMKSSRHQSPEPPPRLSRGSSTENSFIANNQSPLAARRTFLEATSTASPSLSRR